MTGKRSAAEYAHLKRLVMDVRPDPLQASIANRMGCGSRLLELLKFCPRADAVERVVDELDADALRGIALSSVATFRQQMLDADEYNAFWASDETPVFD